MSVLKGIRWLGSDDLACHGALFLRRHVGTFEKIMKFIPWTSVVVWQFDEYYGTFLMCTQGYTYLVMQWRLVIICLYAKLYLLFLFICYIK